MKPMIFSVQEAFDQLKQRGKVTSARSQPREEGEEVWIRKTRTGEKQFEADITHITKICWTDKRNLYGHLHDHDLISGFNTHIDWYKKLEELHDEIPNPLYIHTVEKKSEAPNDLRKTSSEVDES